MTRDYHDDAHTTPPLQNRDNPSRTHTLTLPSSCAASRLQTCSTHAQRVGKWRMIEIQSEIRIFPIQMYIYYFSF